MPDTILPPEDDFRQRFRYIILFQRLRRPLAVAGICLALLALFETIMQLDVLLRPTTSGVATHPTTALCMIALCMGLLNFRANQRPPIWRYLLGGAVLTFLLGTLVYRWIISPLTAGADPVVTGFGMMGSDTAITLCLFVGAVLLRRHAGKLAVALAIGGCVIMLCAFIALSYGKTLIEGQMAASTLLALLPIALSVLTIFAHRPVLRVMLLSGPVGLRTRMTMLVGFAVPWSGGFVLHRYFGLPDRLIPVEAIICGITILSMAGVAVTSALFHERVDRARRQMAQRLAKMATVDPLTKALNRNGITRELEARWSMFQALRRPQCMILLDLDHFKSINDNHGHDVGDQVLAKVVEQTRPHLRTADRIGRWGGEEFIFLFDDIGPDAVASVAERLRQAISRISLPGTGQEHVTGSLGIAFFRSDDADYGKVIKRADAALYEAKRNGRNQVRLSRALQPYTQPMQPLRAIPT